MEKNDSKDKIQVNQFKKAEDNNGTNTIDTSTLLDENKVDKVDEVKMNENIDKLPKIGETRYISQFYYNGISKVPKESESSMRSWYRYFPQHYWRLWDDHSFSLFMRDHYSAWMITYKKLVSIEQKSNFAKYLLLFHFGGIFSHIDVEYCMGDYQGILEKSGIVFFESSISKIKYLTQLEKYELDYTFPWKTKKNMDWIRSKIMASIPRHPFWIFIMSAIARNVTCKREDYFSDEDFVSLTTGDIFLSVMVEKYKNKFINIFISKNNFITLPIIEAKRMKWNIENKIEELKDYIINGKQKIEDIESKKLKYIEEKRKYGNFTILDKEDFFYKQRYNFHYIIIISIFIVLTIVFFVYLFYEKKEQESVNSNKKS